ncbi:PH domain-containing protein [Chloropicon primus]|uniref:PH domain-containing protein n=1 Tax=Chloropicon primus TaxID=1764295 RepID=A0A5B8MPX2_9CHLO|nr:hypothetical protein A3770_06p41730 [Chloropicon primus]UPR00866.1 PH domain-containing protein [Chloropicon primus]|eukprot:QDZ21655.1 hypothetical protein A3770_06p41730 [Chloropicon primus]
MSTSPATPKVKKRGSIIADTKEKLASPQTPPPKSSVDKNELNALRKTSLVTRRSSSFNSGEIAKMAQTPSPKSTPLTPEEADVIEKAKETRAKEQEKEEFEKSIDKATRRKSRVSEASLEVAKGEVDIKKEIARRSTKEMNSNLPATQEDALSEMERREAEEKAFKRQREVSAFAHALKRDSLVEDNLHGDQYKARKGELAAAHSTYQNVQEEKKKGGRGTVSIPGGEVDVKSLDGAIRVKAKVSVGENNDGAAENGQQPDWQKKGWNNERKLTGKRGFLLKKGGSKRNEKGRSVKLFTRHNWNTRFFMLNTSTKELSYFRNEVDPQPLGILKLPDFTIQRIAHHVHGFVLELNGPNRRGFLIAAANTKELEDWEGAINSFCATEEK